MRILQIFHFRTPKEKTDGEIFDFVFNSLKPNAYVADGIQFCLENAPVGLRKVDPVSRAVKCFPELAPFRGSYETKWDRSRVELLSNNGSKIHERVAEPSTISTAPRSFVNAAILSEILHGVPKRFPFWAVDIFFGNLAALNVAGLPAADFDERPHSLTITAPGVNFRSHWRAAKRSQSLTALVSLPTPEGNAMPALPAETENLLNMLGKRFHTELVITPSREDRPAIDELIARGREIAKQYNDNPFAGRPEISFPQTLPVVAPNQQLGVPLMMRRDAGLPSIKELLKKELGLLGYRYQSSLSGQGNYELIKRSSQNYCLNVSVDASPIAGQFHPGFFVETPFALFSVAIKLQPHSSDYPINEHLADVVKNTAFAAAVLEETLVPELAKLLGPAPPWFAAINGAR
jgi:hypothetical protein